MASQIATVEGADAINDYLMNIHDGPALLIFTQDSRIRVEGFSDDQKLKNESVFIKILKRLKCL